MMAMTMAEAQEIEEELLLIIAKHKNLVLNVIGKIKRSVDNTEASKAGEHTNTDTTTG